MCSHAASREYSYMVIWLCRYIVMKSCIYVYECIYVYTSTASREQRSTERRHAVGADVCAPAIVHADAHMPSAMPMQSLGKENLLHGTTQSFTRSCMLQSSMRVDMPSAMPMPFLVTTHRTQ